MRNLTGTMMAAALMMSSAAFADVDGWLNWRGPEGIGVSREKGLPANLAVGTPVHRWTIKIAGGGTPVVAAAVGGLTSIIEDGKTGFLVESRDALAFAAPIERLIRDRAFAQSMGEAAEQRSRRYAWTMTAARLRLLFSELSLREPTFCQ